MFVLIISLLFIGIESKLFRIHDAGVHVLDPLDSFIGGHCSEDNCPPLCLYASCLCLLLNFLFIPIGALPQFITTGADMFIMIFLLIVAQGFYIRGLKIFSKALYLSLDSGELNLIFKFTVVFMTVGGALSWYVLVRGIPGNFFSLDTFAALPLWSVAGNLGKTGLVLFFIVFAVTSPCRRAHSLYMNDNIPLPQIFDAVRSIICPAIIVSIFIPWKIGLFFGLSGLGMYTADFIFFWVKVFLLQIIVVPFIRGIYTKYNELMPENLKFLIIFLFGLAGTVFLMADLYL